ncbi:GYD domain-containing protein [Streptomyces sp. NBC_00878]|uniref:GYD domain-containing protein n=1 Tax=Streptomyces sp. NBC_00878 TaxID=2975854 RepID=UPI0022548810|nr:GYD domain-containing protein [Streptomyces sp. NBC_00878]MCX4903538.1 GYD domain-containing protein [Streptomyces sp. NBC_00878]
MTAAPHAGGGRCRLCPGRAEVSAVHALGRIECAIAQAPDDDWERHSCGNGAKGPRLYDWAAARLSTIDDFDGDQPTRQRWVLARRSQARPDETACYLAYAPDGTAVAELLCIAGTHGATAEAFGAAENECGLEPVRDLPVSGLVPAHLVDRMVRSIGGRLRSMYWAFGDDDVYVTVDLPGDASAAAMGMVVSAAGGVRTSTVVLLSFGEIDEAVRQKLEYHAPGA